MARRHPPEPPDPPPPHAGAILEAGDRSVPVYVFTRDAVRQLDRLAIESFGLPGIALMENAARGCAEIAREMLSACRHENPAVLIVCGPGNNGGDGLAIARHLHNAEINVHVALASTPEKMDGDAGINLRVVQKMHLPLTVLPTIGAGKLIERLAEGARPPELLIDALLGTGLTGSLRGPSLEIIPAMNALRKLGTRVLAIDLPSGMDADTGASLGQTVIADVTATMAGLKKGFESLEAQPFLGETRIVDIGVPRELLATLGKVRTPREHPPEDPHPEPPPRDRAPRRR